MESWILTAITFFPLLSALTVLFLKQEGAIKRVATAFSLIPLVLPISDEAWQKSGF